MKPILPILLTMILGLWSADDVRAQETLPTAAPEPSVLTTGEPTDDEVIRQRLEQALLRYRNLSADARETERAWLNGTAELIRRVEERLRQFKAETPDKVAAESSPVRAVVPPTIQPASVVTPATGPSPLAPHSTVPVQPNDCRLLTRPMPPSAGVSSQTASQRTLDRARRLEVMATDLLTLAAELRASTDSFTTPPAK